MENPGDNALSISLGFDETQQRLHRTQTLQEAAAVADEGDDGQGQEDGNANAETKPFVCSWVSKRPYT